MTAGKAVALFVAWFALTVALFGVSVTAVFSDVALMVYSLFEDEPNRAIGLINNTTMLILPGVLPIFIVAWKRERIYTLLGGDLTNVRRALVLLAVWVALTTVSTLNATATYLFAAVAFGLLFEVVDINYRIENLLISLTTVAITIILPLVLAVWNRRLIYDLLRVDSWFGAKSE